MSQALKEARERAEKALVDLAKIGEERAWTEDERTQVAERKAEIADLKEREALSAEAASMRSVEPVAQVDAVDIRSIAKPTGKADIKVEARSPYAEDSDANFFGDMRAAKKGDDSAYERLQRHYDATGDAESALQLRTYSSTTDGEGGHLVAPAYLQNEFADLLAAGRPTANLVQRVPIDSGMLQYTDNVTIPTQTGATAVGAATENSSLTSTDATFSSVTAQIARRGGRAVLPNFLLDRSMPGAEGVILKDLAKRAGIDVDTFVLNNSGTNAKGLLQETGLGGATYTAGTATMAGLWPVLLNAIQDVSGGIFEKPDAIIMHTRRWFWILAQLDTANRPYIGAVMPQNALGTGGVQAPPGFGGAVAPAGQILGIPVYLDDSVPTTFGAGTDEDRIIVGKMDEAWLLETAPKFAVSRDANFSADQSVLRVTYDLGFTCARRKAAFSIISGTGLNDVN